jgi:hypothetical protein
MTKMTKISTSLRRLRRMELKVTTKRTMQRKGPMKQEVAATVASYIVLLPMRDENYVRRNFYYVVTHNWEIRNSNGEFKVPCTITIRMSLNVSTRSLGLSMK